MFDILEGKWMLKEINGII